MDRTDNDERADRADYIVGQYITEHGDAGTEETITDIIANLLHLAEREGLVPDSIIALARLHYEVEREEAGEACMDRAERERRLGYDHRKGGAEHAEQAKPRDEGYDYGLCECGNEANPSGRCDDCAERKGA